MKKYSTVGKRVLAAIIDSIILYPISYLVSTYNTSNYILQLLLLFIEILIWTGYFVILDGKLGQTLGKKILNIKILDLNEEKTIGIKRAFFRDGVWFVGSTIGLVYFLNLLLTNSASPDSLEARYENYITIVSLVWAFIQLITMLTNQKRRGIHDYMANSVVVNLDFQRAK